jgi:hypothetical protein
MLRKQEEMKCRLDWYPHSDIPHAHRADHVGNRFAKDGQEATDQIPERQSI